MFTGKVRSKLPIHSPAAIRASLRMIQKCVFVIGLVPGLGLAVPAQEGYPRLQLFGGVSVATRGIGWEKGGTPTPGWQASLTGNFQRRFGVTADFGGHYNAGTQFYQFLLGPSFRFAGGNMFARALAGGAQFRPGALPPRTGLAMASGFGMDRFCTSDGRACWTGAIDYVADHACGQWKHTVRVGVGIVFNFHHTR